MIRSAPATFRSRSFWRKRRLLELVFRQSLYQAFLSLFRRARVGTQYGSGIANFRAHAL